VQEQPPHPLLSQPVVQVEVAVLVVAEQRMAGVRQVHADLVRAAGKQPYFQETELRRAFQGLHLGGGGHAACLHAHAALALRIDILMERVAQRPAVHLARGERQVDLLDLAVAQHAMQLDQRAAFLGDDQQPRGVPVEPVGELQDLGLRAAGAQSLDHAEAHAAAAVHRHAGGLVDHQHGGVFVGDRKFGRLRPALPLGDADRRHPDPVAGLQAVLGLDPAAVDADFAAAQDTVDVAFRHALQAAQEEVVDPLRGRFFPDFEGGRPSLA
jgi:hypothetical protein